MNATRIGLAVRRLLALAVVLGLWEALAQFGVLDPFYLPPPSKIAATLLAPRSWAWYSASSSARCLAQPRRCCRGLARSSTRR